MQDDTKLYPFEEPEQAPKRKTLHLATPPAPALQLALEQRPVERPWPRQHAWRNLQRQLTKNVARRPFGKDESR